MVPTATLSKRQYYDGWYWSDTGAAVRYAIIAAIILIILLYFVGGYFHARRRAKKGLPLKAYHRWMIRRPNQQPHGPVYYQNPTGQQGYPMQPYQNNPPPPAYNTYVPPPPAYAPPEGASKAMADQNWPTNQWGNAGGPSQPTAPPAAARY